MRPFHVFWAAPLHPDPNWKVPAHAHGFHEVVVISQGRMFLRTKDGELTAGAGDILFYRAGLVHQEWSDPEAPFASRAVAFTLNDKLSWLPLRVRDVRGRVQQLATWIGEDEVNAPARTMRPFLEAMVQELRYCCDYESDGWMEGLRVFMRDHLPEPITLDDLAREGKMSKFAFLKKFKKMSGRTPMAELRFMRMDRAWALLQNTKLPVKAIAPQVGIGDEFQLSKLFRVQFGRCPSEVRKFGLRR